MPLGGPTSATIAPPSFLPTPSLPVATGPGVVTALVPLWQPLVAVRVLRDLVAVVVLPGPPGRAATSVTLKVKEFKKEEIVKDVKPLHNSAS